MDILLAMPEVSREAGHQLYTTLKVSVGADYRVTAAGLNEALESIVAADSVVLIHGQPTVRLHAFVDEVHGVAPLVPILIAGVPDDSEMIVDYILCGAHGCLIEGHNINELVMALETVSADDRYLPPRVQAALIERYAELNREFGRFDLARARDLDPLTEREHEVLALVGQGLTNREIADRLYIEIGTVKNHVHSILRKLNLADRHVAADYYRQGQAFVLSDVVIE